MGYKNENLRATDEVVKDHDEVIIEHNDKLLLSGDKDSICVIWNNFVGCNFEDKENHLNWLDSVYKKALRGELTLVGIKRKIRIKKYQIDWHEE